jgi:2-polyprenyl-3-methyl-5-hydroxy-6-metoxy-1,4-benzoquinol methylase
MDNLIIKPGDYYQNVRHEMFKYIPKEAKKILEIGCGEGNFGVCLKKEIGAEVWGVEYNSAHAALAEKQLDKVFCGDIAQIVDQLPSNYFDVVVCNDVLEHLTDPYTVLEKLKSNLSPNGIVVSSLPNIRYFRSFFKILFEKNWDYTESGTMDFTHFRFFTVNSIRKMYENLNYDVLLHEGINATKSLKPWPLIFLSFGYFSDIKYLQYATVAKPKK